MNAAYRMLSEVISASRPKDILLDDLLSILTYLTEMFLIEENSNRIVQKKIKRMKNGFEGVLSQCAQESGVGLISIAPERQRPNRSESNGMFLFLHH
jgi:hypothetical protein